MWLILAAVVLWGAIVAYTIVRHHRNHSSTSPMDTNHPLFIALYTNDNDTVAAAMRALDPGALSALVINWAIYVAANSSRHEILCTLLADPRFDINTPNRFGIPPLMGAIAEGHLPAVQHLLNHGARVDVVSSGGISARQLATAQARDDIVALLDAAQPVE